MMGSKGSRNGIEIDALDRRGRRALLWKRGELRKIKRQFWKRDRWIARRLGRRTADD